MLLGRRECRQGQWRWSGARRGRIACRVRRAVRARLRLRGPRPTRGAGQRPVGRRLMQIWADHRAARDGFHGDDGAWGAGDGRGRMGVGHRRRGVGRRCERARGCMLPGSRITSRLGPRCGGCAGDAKRREHQHACDRQDAPPRGRRHASTCGVRHAGIRHTGHTGPPSRRLAVAQCVLSRSREQPNEAAQHACHCMQRGRDCFVMERPSRFRLREPDGLSTRDEPSADHAWSHYTLRAGAAITGERRTLRGRCGRWATGSSLLITSAPDVRPRGVPTD
jgi:hypothetical protein